MLDTYQLQIFLTVIEAGNYTEAARRLHLTQPAVSRHIRLLQEQLGVRLFRRVGRQMLPTHAGERLIETARRILALSQRVEEEMAGLRGEVVGMLRVAGSGTPAWHALAQLLPSFRKAYPGVGFHIQPLPDEGAGTALREGRLDLILTEGEFNERGVTADLVLEMETILVAPLEEPWERRKRIYLRTLPETPLILPQKGTPARRLLEESLAQKEVTLSPPVQAVEVDDPGTALPLVAAGLGTALLPRPLIQGFSRQVHPIVLWPSFPWPFYLVRRASPISRTEEVFCDFILEGQG